MEPEYHELTEMLVQDGYLKTKELIEAFDSVDRADFVPVDQREQAYANIPLSIGHEQTISQPLTVAFMLELLEPKAGEKVFEVGSGSGWQTAILAEVVGKTAFEGDDASRGSVVAIELIPELKAMTEANLAPYGYAERGIVTALLGDGSKGYKKGAPYDKIIAAASAEGDVPVQWKRQLKIGGRIVAPVGNSIVVIDKVSKTKYVTKEHFGFNFVPLVIS